MKFVRFLVVFCAILAFNACKQSTDGAKTADSGQNGEQATSFLSPQTQYGALFVDVLKDSIFPDPKTFLDAVPKIPVSQLLKKYQSEKDDKAFDLKSFVLDHFSWSVTGNAPSNSDPQQPINDYLQSQWAVLTRQPNAPDANSTLLPLPKPYIVPGGRFDELHYADSYFMMLGLEAAGRRDLIEIWWTISPIC